MDREKKNIIIVDNSILSFAIDLANGVPINSFMGDEEDDKDLLYLISFLEEAFPENVEYNGRWMIEGVYTHPNHRGKGLAAKVVSAVVEEGRRLGFRECLVSCAVGNHAARWPALFNNSLLL